MPFIVIICAIVLTGIATATYSVMGKIPSADSVRIPVEVSITQTAASLTPTLSPSYMPTSTAAKIAPARGITNTPMPTATYAPTTTPRIVPLVTNTPQPKSDTQAPVIDSMTGPADGSTVSFNSFCFPVHITDNVMTGLQVRYSFNSGPNDWNSNYAPCYQNLPNGYYVFVIQARDAAGNVSATVSRSFHVAVPSPTSSQPIGSPTPIQVTP